jgi:hypothetical protein
MVNLPDIYRKSPPAIESYDWVDNLQGMGYLTLYASNAVDTAGRNYLLVHKAVDCSSYYNAGSGYGIYTDTNGADIDIDFDISIQKPLLTATGIAFVEMTIWKAANASGHYHVNIYHVHGVTETLLGTATSQTYAVTGGAISYRDLFKISFTGKQFAIGDFIRFNIDSDLGGTKSFYFYHDPTSAVTLTDAVSRTIGTDLTMYIPCKLDV